MGRTCILYAFVDEFGLTHDFEVWLEVANQSPEPHNIRERITILRIKQL